MSDQPVAVAPRQTLTIDDLGFQTQPHTVDWRPIASAPQDAARVDGQRIANDWEIEVVDVHTLYRCHPNCVELKPRLSEIKNLLKIGATIQGIRALAVVKSSVKLPPRRAAIDV